MLLLYVNPASPFKLTPLPPVITRLSALFDIVTCVGNEVKFAPLIAGRVPVKFAAFV